MFKTIYQIRPLTQNAEAWLKDSCHTEPWHWLGHTLAIDSRYVESIQEAIADAHLQAEFEIF